MTPSDISYSTPAGYVSASERLNEEIPNSRALTPSSAQEISVVLSTDAHSLLSRLFHESPDLFKIVDIEWTASVQGEPETENRTILKAATEEKLKQASDLFFVLSHGAIAFELYMALYQSLDTFPTSSVHQETTVVSLIRSAQTPIQAQKAKEILHGYFDPFLATGGAFDHFLPRMLGIWLDHRFGQPDFLQLESAMNSVPSFENRLQDLTQERHSMNAVTAIFLEFGFHLYVSFPASLQIGGPLRRSQVSFSQILDKLDLKSQCIDECLDWCQNELRENSVAFQKFVAPSVSPSETGAPWLIYPPPTSRARRESLHLFFFLWDRCQLSSSRKPQNLTWNLTAEEETGVSTTELLLIVCNMIALPWRFVTYPAPSSPGYFQIEKLRTLNRCLDKVRKLKSRRDGMSRYFYEGMCYYLNTAKMPQQVSNEITLPSRSYSRHGSDYLSEICLLSSLGSSSGSYAEFKSLARRIGQGQEE